MITIWGESISCLDLFFSGIQALTLILLFIYTLKTSHMASAANKSAIASVETLKEMRANRSPFVVVCFELEAVGPFIDLVVRNTGRGLAKELKLDFAPNLENSRMHEKQGISFVNKIIPLLTPGAELRTFFESWYSLSDSVSFPTQYKVSISYLDQEGQSYSREDSLDLSIFMGMTRIGKKDLGDVVREFEKLVAVAKKMEGSIEGIQSQISRGLYFLNPEIVVTICESASSAKRLLVCKLHEACMFWDMVYGDDTDKLLRPYPDESRSRAAQLGLQIAALSSRAIELLSQSDTDALKRLTDILFQLGVFMHWSGRERLDEYVELGRTMVELARSIAVQIESTGLSPESDCS